MRCTLFFVFFLCYFTLDAQFSLFVSGSTTTTLDLRIPSGSGDRYLLLLDRDSIRIDSLPVIDCSAGCTRNIISLDPATIYLIQLYRNETIQDERWAITSSTSTGTVEVYFTTTVDERLSNGSLATALGGAALEGAIVQLIDQAHTSIDVMLYNINRRPISNALIAAHNRGVRVRYLTSDDTNNTALSNPSPEFPVLLGNLGSGLMHNKVFVIDANDPDRAMVVTGATNMTQGQIYTDHNNQLFIQDQSLARVYEKEVDEMWGSRSAIPNISKSKFGEAKSDDTPHEVYIKGTRYEVYFSPSDNTSFHIVNALNTAQYNCYFALLLITRQNLAATLLNLHNRNVDVKGLVNNQSENGTEFPFLVENGVFVLQYKGSRQLHHKYAFVDAGVLEGTPKLITGCHNWSNNAENRNDENTLIIHDGDLVNIFFQEFQARWCETFAGSDCLLTTSTQDVQVDEYIRLHFDSGSKDLYCWTEGVQHWTSIQVFSTKGFMIYGKVDRDMFSFSDQSSFYLGDLAPGIYHVKFSTQSKFAIKSFSVQ